MMLPDHRVHQRDSLLEITRALTEELNLEKLLERILNISVEMLAGQAGLIALRAGISARLASGGTINTSGWRVAASNGLPPVFIRTIETWLAQIAYHEDPQRFEIPEISRMLGEIAYTASLGLLTGVGLPMVAQGEVIGMIFVFRSYAGSFSSNDRTVLSSFASQAAIAVRNAQLYQQVTQEKQRLNGLLDSAADGILILAPDLRIERSNPAFARLSGMTAEQISAKAHEDIIRWEKRPQGLTLEGAAAGGWPLTAHASLYVEGDLRRPGLAPLPVGITYSPLLSAEGVLLNVIATVRDITRFRQAEELKSTFVSVVSHELKTPVALIKGYVSTLRREDAAWDRAVIADSLEVIEEEADRLADMIENLLDASRLQAGAFALKRSDMNLGDLVRRIAERFKVQLRSHRLVVDVPENIPIIVADETRLQQVLSNLVANAIKYSPGGEIRIELQVRPDNLIVCVSDQGPGIAQQDIPHIFDRFYRAPEAARNTKGTGLGLYLARAIVEAHGGRIWADPAPGLGARICFSLPRG